MAIITIVIIDINGHDANGNVSLQVDFDPAIDENAIPTPAQQFALDVLDGIRKGIE